MPDRHARDSCRLSTLRELRAERGVSLRQLAADTGISNGLLSLMERGLLIPNSTQLGSIVDAHRIGNLSWDETKARLGRLPTPREQYDAAVSHLNTWGDGWTCPGP